MEKSESDFFISHHSKNQFQVESINVKDKLIKFLEDYIGKYHYSLEQRQIYYKRQKDKDKKDKNL